MSDILDRLNDPAALQAELKKRGIDMKVTGADVKKLPKLELTEDDLAHPERIAEKLNTALAAIVEIIGDSSTQAVNSATKKVDEGAREKELRELRTFLKDKKFVSPATGAKKNQDVIDLMDFYYQNGDSIEAAYKKACKKEGLEGGVIGKELSEEEKAAKIAADKEKAAKGKTKEKESSTPVSRKSGEHSSAGDADKGEGGEPKKPVSVREAASSAFDMLASETKDAGKEVPFTE